MQYGNFAQGTVFGVRNERQRWMRSVREGVLADPIPTTYAKVYLDWNDALFNVESQIEFFPHLITWGNDNVKHPKPMCQRKAVGLITPYLVNMNEAEQALLMPQLEYALAVGHVNHVQCFDGTIQISISIAGVQRTLLINVMNMMDYCEETGTLDEYATRWTLN